MPYAFAHPAAIVPVSKLLGRRAVPSALAIGSMIPDAWYLVPIVDRGQSHSLAGALYFCVPAGLAAYFAFHLVFKQAMLALLPPRWAARVAGWTTVALPAVALGWVLLSLVLGIATHILWDAFTHSGYFGFVEQPVFGVRLHRMLQHTSTLLGGSFVACWVWRKLRSTRPARPVPTLSRHTRIAVLAALFFLPLAAFLAVFGGVGLRWGAVTALQAFGVVALGFALAWSAHQIQTSAGRAGR